MDYHTILQNISSQDWGSFFTFLGGAGVISVALQTTKHLAGTKWGHIFVAFLLGLFSFLVSFANLFLGSGFSNTNPLPLLGQHTADLTALAFGIYHLSVNPLYVNKVLPFLEKLALVSQELAAEKQFATPLETPVVPETQQQFE
jgi:hypothetical protein